MQLGETISPHAALLQYVQSKQFLAFNTYLITLFSQVLKYIDLAMSLTFAFHSLRIKYQPSEGTMMIDLSTIQSLELIQNIQNSKSKDCLFGVMNETLTPMGSRLLRSNILQPSTQKDVLNQRYEAVHEFTVKEDMFFQTRLGQYHRACEESVADFLQLLSLLTMWKSCSLV